jgi:hypothetical protein
VCAEGVAGTGKRARAWTIAFGADHPAQFKLYPKAVDLGDPGQLRAVIAWATIRRPILVVVDTLARSLPGRDENSSRDIGTVIDNADLIRQACGACVLLVHHTGYDASHERGSTALRAALVSSIPVKRDERNITIGGPQTKQKDIEPGPPVELELVTVDLPDGSTSCVLRAASGRHASKANDRHADAVRDALRDDFRHTGASRKDLAALLDLDPALVSKATNALLEDGSIFNAGTDWRPIWRIVER